MKSTLFTLCLLCAACSLAHAQNVADWAAIESEVATGDDLHFVRPADLKANKPVALLLKNGSDAPVRAQLSLGVKERSDAFVPLVARGEIEIPAQGQISLPLSAAQIGSRLGVKYVDWKLTGGGRNASGHASFALINPVGITPGVQRGEFIFGNQGVRGYFDSALKEKISRAAMIVGAESMRGGSDWRNLEPQPGQYNWSGEDEVVEIAAKYGAEVQ